MINRFTGFDTREDHRSNVSSVDVSDDDTPSGMSSTYVLPLCSIGGVIVIGVRASASGFDNTVGMATAVLACLPGIA